MRKIIIINGPMEAGKDTFIDIIKTILGPTCLVKNLSTINPVNKKLIELGWDGETKDKLYRDLASMMKQAWNKWSQRGPTFQVLDELNTWYQYYPHAESKDVLLFLHSREEDELYELIDIFREARYNYHTLFVIPRKVTVDKNTNPSDYKTLSMINNYEFTIDNNGTKGDLVDKAVDFLTKIGMMREINN